MTSEELHPDFVEVHSESYMQPGIIDLDTAEYRIIPDRSPLLTRIHDFIGDVGTRFNEFKQELAYSAAAEHAVIHDLRPDRLWSQFWDKGISPAQRALIATYAAAMMAGPQVTMEEAKKMAFLYGSGNAAVYHMSADDMRNLHDPQGKLAQADDGTSALDDTLYLPWVNQPIPRNPVTPSPTKPLPSATPSPTREGPPSPPPPPSSPPPSATWAATATPTGTPTPPEPTREIPPLERYSRAPLISGIARIENPGQDTSNYDLLGEEWAVIASGFRANDPVQKGRIVRFTASDTDLTATPRPPDWPTPAPAQRPLTEAAQLFISQDQNHLVGPIYYENGYWFLNGERFATYPGSTTEDPRAELYYYIDNQGNLRVELRTQGSDQALGALSVALSQEDTQGTGLPVINARVALRPNQGLIENIEAEGLVQYDLLKGQESEQPLLKNVLSQVGGGKVYLFEAESPRGSPLDSDGEYPGNGRHNGLLTDPELIRFFEEGKAGGVIWREASHNFAQHYGGSDQIKVLADRFDAEVFISSGHEFRYPAGWVGSRVIKSEQNNYRDFVNLIKEMLRNFRNRYARQDNFNPIVIDMPLTQDGESGVIPKDRRSYEFAFEGHPQEDHAPGPMMEAAAGAAPKGKNEEWGTKFAVFEAAGLSREERRNKLKGFFKKFGLDKAKVPQGSYVLIHDEFMEDEGFFTSDAFATGFSELETSNPGVRTIVALRPFGSWIRTATPEQIADAITPLLRRLVDGEIDIGLQRTLMANPAIEARIRELAEEKVKAQGAPTPDSTPQAIGQLIPLPNSWKVQPRKTRAPRKPKGTFARH